MIQGLAAGNAVEGLAAGIRWPGSNWPNIPVAADDVNELSDDISFGCEEGTFPPAGGRPPVGWIRAAQADLFACRLQDTDAFVYDYADILGADDGSASTAIRRSMTPRPTAW